MDQTKRFAQITKIQELAREVKEFTLSFTENFVFQAGQFLALHFETEQGAIKRFYSIASSPENKHEIKLCIKLLPGSDKPASRYFEKLKPGDKLTISGPGGAFTFQGKQAQVLLLATGTGLAPFISFLLSKLPKQKHHFQLLFGVRTQADLFYTELLQQLKKLYPKYFDFELILSRPEGTNWQGKTGHITDHLKNLKSLQSTETYLCGNPTMVVEARQELLALGLSEESIFSEAY